MTERDMGPVKARLEELRAEVLDDRANLPIALENASTDYGAGSYYADDATDTFLRERNLTLRGNVDDLVTQIDHALARIDAGIYGICERCGRPINPERLEVLPYATRCIVCARDAAGETPAGPPRA